MRIDPRVSQWIMAGCPGSRNLCLHIPSFMVLNAIQRKSPQTDLQTVIAFLISDLVCQIKDGDQASHGEVKVVWGALLGEMPDPSVLFAKEEVNVVDLPPRKK